LLQPTKAATSNGGGFFFVRTVTMAFTIRDLSVLAYANGFTLWHYKAANDSLADVACDDYFADATDMMATGDIILISATKGCRALCITIANAGNVRSVPLG
jgi:hypothetical protein